MEYFSIESLALIHILLARLLTRESADIIIKQQELDVDVSHITDSQRHCFLGFPVKLGRLTSGNVPLMRQEKSLCFLS